MECGSSSSFRKNMMSTSFGLKIGWASRKLSFLLHAVSYPVDPGVRGLNHEGDQSPSSDAED
jgi:hypothetical protein